MKSQYGIEAYPYQTWIDSTYFALNDTNFKDLMNCGEFDTTYDEKTLVNTETNNDTGLQDVLLCMAYNEGTVSGCESKLNELAVTGDDDRNGVISSVSSIPGNISLRIADDKGMCAGRPPENVIYRAETPSNDYIDKNLQKIQSTINKIDYAFENSIMFTRLALFR